jgi:hypothetical protein
MHHLERERVLEFGVQGLGVSRVDAPPGKRKLRPYNVECGLELFENLNPQKALTLN